MTGLPPAGSASVMEPRALALAGLYAEALIGLMGSDDQAEATAGQLDALVAMMDEIDGFERLLTTRLIGDKHRQELVRRILGGRVSRHVEALVAILARNGRAGLLRMVVGSFRKLLQVRQGKVEVTVTSAVELDRSQREAITQALRQALGAEPLLETTVDQGLFGGLVVRVGDCVYDASLAGRLDHLSRQVARRIADDFGRKLTNAVQG